MAEILLPDWIGGKKRGHEWTAERKANGGLGDSLSVNLNTGVWASFSSGAKGGDLIDLYAHVYHLDVKAARRAVSEAIGGNADQRHVLPRRPPPQEPETTCEPIPDNAPPILPHPIRGEPSAVYRYGDAMLVLRFDLPDGQKTFSQYTWRHGKWLNKGHPGPLPLYHHHLLFKHPDAPVILVEGEKCVEIATPVLKRYVVMTWAGGAKALGKTDWTALKDRDVLLWPDADQPGCNAMAEIAKRLAGIATRVRVIIPEDSAPTGWDLADAILDDGWDAKQIAAYATNRLKVTVDTPTAPAVDLSAAESSESADSTEPEPVKEDSGSTTAPPALLTYTPKVPADSIDDILHNPFANDASAVVSWESLDLDTNQGGLPFPTVANASGIVQKHPRLAGKIWYDSFRDKVYHSLKGGERQWTDADDVDLAVFIQQALRLSKFNVSLVSEGLGHAARRHQRNSLTDWLKSLVWDKTERLETWLGDTLGLELNEYTMAVSRNWPVAMVARAFVPGCQVDHMVVLEGKMGRGKSRFLEVLAGEWFKSLPMAFGDKEFLQAIQGAWLIEVPDMTGFGKREHSQILATVTIRTDEYRASYGRRSEPHPRVAVFAATSETDDYLNDTRGRRRYWPLRCTDIDLDLLRGMREQVFAEAVAKYRAGVTWYEMPLTTDMEQLQRADPDLWTDKVAEYAEYQWAQSAGKTTLITSSLLLENALKIELGDQGQPEKNRISRIMRERGWIQSRTSGHRYWLKVIRREE